MPVFNGQSQTVDIKSVSDISGGYGIASLTTTSSSYVAVSGMSFTFTGVTDGMKIYVDGSCGINADTSSAASAAISINDNGTTTVVDTSEVQSLLANVARLGSLLATYTVSHCGTSGAGTVSVTIVGRRVVGAGNAYVLYPLNLRARLARD